MNEKQIDVTGMEPEAIAHLYYAGEGYGYWTSKEEFDAALKEDSDKYNADFYDRILKFRDGEASGISYGTKGYYSAMKALELVKEYPYLAKLHSPEDKIALVRVVGLMGVVEV